MQRQTPRRDNFQLRDRAVFSTDSDFENIPDLAPIMKPVPLPLIAGLSIRSRRHAINSITRAETHHGISLSRDRRGYRLQLREGSHQACRWRCRTGVWSAHSTRSSWSFESFDQPISAESSSSAVSFFCSGRKVRVRHRTSLCRRGDRQLLKRLTVYRKSTD